MPIEPEPITSWRALDDAVAEAGADGSSVHSSLVFRGLARASYADRSGGGLSSGTSQGEAGD